MAKVFIRVQGDLVEDEVVARLVTILPSTKTVDEAIASGRAWALENVAKQFDLDPSTVDINLMKSELFT